jgi:hypothetical protein
MTDEPEIPIVQVEGELLPAPKRKKPGPKGPRKPNARFRSGVVQKRSKLVWLASARVTDMEAFHRLRGAGLGGKRIARALSTAVATAQKLMSGRHWQQDAEKVRIFNKAKGASIDPETGVPTAQDLVKFGGVYSRPLATDDQGTKDLRQIVETAGVSAPMVDEAVRRLRLATGALEVGDLPAKVDTKWLQDSIDAKIGLTLTLLDSVTLAGASVADLTRLFNALTEKRALLRGEPTAIVRNEQRGGLDKLAGLLLAEAQRRGITVDLAPGPGGYQEITGETNV